MVVLTIYHYEGINYIFMHIGNKTSRLIINDRRHTSSTTYVLINNGSKSKLIKPDDSIFYVKNITSMVLI